MSGIIEVLTRAISFILIIATGYGLKKIGFFTEKDFFRISKIVIKITLPCAIIYNFNSISLNYALLLLCLIGFLCNVLFVTIGYLTNLRANGDKKAFDMINLSGYNIGNFTLPFVQSFLGPMGFAATSLFDAGNAIMCTGITYTAASMAKGGGARTSPGQILKSLFSSVPFDSYLVMTAFAIMGIRLPSVLVSYTGTVGNANAFLALLMIGIGFEINLGKEKVGHLVRILVTRMGVSVLLAAAAYFLLPMPLEVRQAMVVVALGPVSGVAPAFTGNLEGDVELASAVNSCSIVMSIVTITAALIVLL